MDFQVIVDNFGFLFVQGFLGFGEFAGGTLRLAIPAIVLGFALGIVIGLGRLAKTRVPSVSLRRFTLNSFAACRW